MQASWGRIQGKDDSFGALVYFKPSDARAREQQHKFDPMGIPGVFAGYSLGPDYTGQGSIVCGLYVIGPNKT